MKAGKEHVVPLSDAAVALLEALPEGKSTDYVFPAPRGGMLSDMSLTAVLKRMERADLTAHGFRSTFREWAGEDRRHDREVVEHALAHQLKDKAEAAYQRGTMLPPRVRLMADWATYCAHVQSVVDNVVHSRGGVMQKLRPEERFPIIEGRPMPPPKKIGRPFDKRLADIRVRAAADRRQNKYSSIPKTAEAYLVEYEPNIANLTPSQIAKKKYQLGEMIREELKKL